MDLELELIYKILEEEEKENIRYLNYVKERQIVLYDNTHIILSQFFLISMNIYFLVVCFQFMTLNNTIILKNKQKKINYLKLE